MKLFNYLSLSFVFLFLFTIVSAQKSIFNLELSNPDKLPSLNIIIDEEDIAKAYLSRQIIFGKDIYNNEVEEQYISSFYEDQKINDAKNLFHRYIFEDLTSYNKKKMGYVDIDVLYYNHKSRITSGFAVIAITFGLGYVIGIPSEINRTDVEIEMKIFDINNNLIKTYYGSAKDRYYSGIFFKKDQRLSNLDALKKAIRNINERVIADFVTINSMLLSLNGN